MADGFLGRWSQRKQDVREGKALAEPVVVRPEKVAERGGVSQPNPNADQATPAQGPALSPASALEAEQGEGSPAASPPMPTLEDAQALTLESDFKPFIAREVAPEVRNAAMKKLFTDPHYNVMDGLDIYIDDYSKPDPLPLSMLRQMASAKFLNLFDDEKDSSPRVAAPVILADNAPAPVDAGASADQPASSTTHPDVATPEAAPPLTTTDSKTPDHADPDLRLQPNHAAGASGAGRSAQ